MSKKARPSFNLDDDKDKPVTAGGVLFYRQTDNTIDLLMVDSRGGYEDLGGCVDSKDKTVLHTVSREVEEESNEQFIKKNVLKRVKKCNDYIYMKRSKYVVYILPATKRGIRIRT